MGKMTLLSEEKIDSKIVPKMMKRMMPIFMTFPPEPASGLHLRRTSP